MRNAYVVVELDVEHIELHPLTPSFEDIIADITDQGLRIAAFTHLVQGV